MSDRYATDLWERTGCVTTSNRFVVLLYLLMRDHLPVGVIPTILRELSDKTDFELTNGFLAQYADYLYGMFEHGLPE